MNLQILELKLRNIIINIIEFSKKNYVMCKIYCIACNFLYFEKEK